MKGKPHASIASVMLPPGVMKSGQVSAKSGHNNTCVSRLLPAPANQGTEMMRA